MDKGDTVINAGAVDVAMSYRKELMPDQGLNIQVFGEVDGEDTEILRFHCFVVPIRDCFAPLAMTSHTPAKQNGLTNNVSPFQCIRIQRLKVADWLLCAA